MFGLLQVSTWRMVSSQFGEERSGCHDQTYMAVLSHARTASLAVIKLQDRPVALWKACRNRPSSRKPFSRRRASTRPMASSSPVSVPECEVSLSQSCRSQSCRLRLDQFSFSASHCGSQWSAQVADRDGAPESFIIVACRMEPSPADSGCAQSAILQTVQAIGLGIGPEDTRPFLAICKAQVIELGANAPERKPGFVPPFIERRKRESVKRTEHAARTQAHSATPAS